MTPYLTFDSVGKRFKTVTALDHFSLSIARGSTLALLGPNGAGKSTLFSCLLGFSNPTTGRIQFKGRPLRADDRALFGYISERVALYPNYSVHENAMFLGELKNCDESDIIRQLERVRLANFSKRKVRELSKGMLQRLGLAIALAGHPQLLVLDEPFNGLDPVLLDEFIAILRQEQQRGATLLISTHTISAIEPLATHVAMLFSGRLGFSGSIQNLRNTYGQERSLESIYQQVARDRSAPLLEELSV